MSMSQAVIYRGQVGRRIVDDSAMKAAWQAKRSADNGISTDGKYPLTIITTSAPLTSDVLSDGEKLGIKRARRANTVGLVVYGFDTYVPCSTIIEAATTAASFAACGLRMTVSVPASFKYEGIEYYDSISKAGLSDADMLSVKRMTYNNPRAVMVVQNHEGPSIVLEVSPFHPGDTTRLRSGDTVKRCVIILPKDHTYTI